MDPCKKIGQGVNVIGEFVTGKIGVVLVAGESPKVVAENGGVKVVGQEYLPTLPALGKKVLVVRQTWVVVVLGVSVL